MVWFHGSSPVKALAYAAPLFGKRWEALLGDVEVVERHDAIDLVDFSVRGEPDHTVVRGLLARRFSLSPPRTL